MTLCKWHTFWMASWLIYCFTAILLHIERKSLLTQSYFWSRNCERNFSFNDINGSIEMLENSWISINFILKEKLYNLLRVPKSDLPEGNYSAPHQTKASYISGTKILDRRFLEICRLLLSKFPRKCSAWASRNGARQTFFLTPTRNMFLFVLREYNFYNVEWIKVS